MAKFTDDQLEAARTHVANRLRAIASRILDEDYGFAIHVTMSDKLAMLQRDMDCADAIERGEHDGNRSVAQGMLYYLTGEERAILP